MTSESVLAIDIGGTKITVARYRRQTSVQTTLVKEREQRYASRDYSGLEAVLADFAAKETEPVTLIGAVAGVAGPVVNGTATVTNLPWSLSEVMLQQRFALPFKLINDLAAHGFGLAGTDPGHLTVLQNGVTPALTPGLNIALIAAGTGLGESLLFWDGKRHVPSPSEGAHADFGPGTPEEMALLEYLWKRYEHVSWERVVSGLDGFRSLYLFWRDRGRIKPIAECESRLAADERADLGEAILAAVAINNPGAIAIVDWMTRLYGAEAGNLALKGMALGGVFVGGGLTAHILPWMRRGRFIEGFLAKGRFRELLIRMPVLVVTDPDLPLRGAARLAFELAEQAR